MVSRAVVTGAAGLIGSHIVDRLLNKGWRVLGIDNFMAGTNDNLRDALCHEKFKLLEVNLANFDESRTAMEGVISQGGAELVWHMAANSDIAAGVADPRVDLENTFMTTFNVLAIMRKLDIRRIAFASSSAVYGYHAGALTEETGPLFPISNYGAMKLASEGIVSAAVESFLERAWIFRFPNVVGPRATHGVIYDFMRKLRVNGHKLDVLGDGNQQKEYLHVSELLDAMFFIVENGTESLNYFNIGANDKGATVRFIADAVIEAMAPGAQKHYSGGKKGWIGDIPSFTYSIEKVMRLGWRPLLTSEQAVVRTINELLSD